MEQPSPEPTVEQSNLPMDPNDEVMVRDEEELKDAQQDITTWSGMTVQVTDRMRESQAQCAQGIISYQANVYRSDEAYYDAMHEDDYELQKYKMLWTIQLLLCPEPMVIPCISIKPCKHTTEKNL